MIEYIQQSRPSYSFGFARSASESANPHLWNGLKGAWCTSLGVQGNQLFDQSGHGNNGTLTNMDVSDWIVNNNGYALDFDGSNDHILVGDVTPLKITGELTISVWINGGSQGNNLGIVSKYYSGISQRGFGVTTNTSQTIYWYYQRAAGSFNSGDRVSSSSVVLDSTLRHVVCTFKPSTYGRIYINGKLDAEDTTDIQSGIADNTADFSIGKIEASDAFTGKIGDVLVYNRILNPNEIMQLYVDPSAPWRLRERVYKAPAASVTVPDDTLSATMQMANSGGMIGGVYA